MPDSLSFPLPPWETGQPLMLTWTEALAWFAHYRPEVAAVYRRDGRTVAEMRPKEQSQIFSKNLKFSQKISNGGVA